MVLALLRILIPLVLIIGALYIVYRMYHRYLEHRDREKEREHEHRLERERRDYETLMDSIEHDEIERELAKERNSDSEKSSRSTTERHDP